MSDKVVIFGWYGSETLGDKAILGGILKNVIGKGTRVEDITLLSFNVDYSNLTVIDLEYPELKVIDLYSVKQDKQFIENNDVYIMGGGPLCDIEEMIYVLEILENAKSCGKKTIIYSCGVGPLNMDKYRYIFSETLHLSDIIQFRDYYTPRKYSELILDRPYEVTIDPAFGYLYAIKGDSGEAIIDSPYVMFCLRRWPEMYSYGLGEDEYKNIVLRLEKLIVDSIRSYHSMNIGVILFPMHNYYYGDDDREYYLELCEKYDLWDQVRIIGHEYSIKESINYFKHATKVFAMRFHSVIFSIALETEFVALDYQIDDGKISGVLEMLGLSSKSLKISDFSELTDMENVLRNIEQQKVDWKHVNAIIQRQISKFV